MSEITFPADKKHRDKYFHAGHFAHPAKMGIPLQRWLIENYTKPGDIILDPMAGCGTVLIACTMGRHVILVELEAKFVQMQKDNWTKIQTLGPEMGYSMGTATILQGDSRNLGVIFSSIEKDSHIQNGADYIITSPPYELMAKERTGGICGRDPSMRQLSYTNKVDAIITSPPYEAGMSGTSREPFWERFTSRSFLMHQCWIEKIF